LTDPTLLYRRVPMVGFYFVWPLIALLFLFWLFYNPTTPSY
jgi:hypothetical protein